MSLASVLGTSYTANENRLEYSVLGKAEQAARPRSAELAATELERSATPPDLVYYYLMNKENVIHSDPEILGGVPVFIGTRVPLRNLIDFLEAGDSIDDFLDSFPSVSRQQAVAALELACEVLTSGAGPS